LSVDDEAQAQRTELAILKALGRIKTQPAKPIEDDEPIIDTTDPSFAKSFQGFINAPGQR
jgi:hypothetical protein